MRYFFGAKGLRQSRKSMDCNALIATLLQQPQRLSATCQSGILAVRQYGLFKLYRRLRRSAQLMISGFSFRRGLRWFDVQNTPEQAVNICACDCVQGTCLWDPRHMHMLPPAAYVRNLDECGENILSGTWLAAYGCLVRWTSSKTSAEMLSCIMVSGCH